MFKIFKKKTEIEILNNNYKELLNKAHRLSTTSRKLSDQKVAKAATVLNKTELLENN
ncbi:MAG: Lacal_2735 family protein [Flavobacteriaceae bacterium]|nr:Lacal_2735 family protein [Flavobacteriaceae bacterium]